MHYEIGDETYIEETNRVRTGCFFIFISAVLFGLAVVAYLGIIAFS